MVILFLTSDLLKAARGQKHPSEAEIGMKESIHWKKYLKKVAQQPDLKNPLAGPIRFEIQPQIKKIHPSNQSTCQAPKKPAKRAS